MAFILVQLCQGKKKTDFATSYNLLKPLSIIRLLPLDPLQEGSSEGGMVGGINNCDLTGIMCRLGSLIMIASGSIDIISQYYVNTL